MTTFDLLVFLVKIRKNYIPNNKQFQNFGILGIRLAQEYSFRIDFLDERICSSLMELRSSLIENQNIHLMTLIPRGKPILLSMEYFDNEPFSSTFTTQVYKGSLKNGLDIAIKVINPKAKHIFLTKLLKLKNRIKQIDFFNPKLSKNLCLKEIYNEIEEINLNKFLLQSEIDTTKKFEKKRKEYEEKYMLDKLAFPQLIPSLSSENYIIGEFIYGTPMKVLLEDIKSKYHTVLEIIRYHFFYIFIVGKFHSDIHPGNIVVGDDSKIYFIDCNTYLEIDDNFRKSFFKFLYNISTRDYIQVAKGLLNMCEMDFSRSNLLAFAEKLREELKEVYNLNLSQINFTQTLMKALKMTMQYGVKLPHSTFNLLKAINRLEKILKKTMHTEIFIKDLNKILEIYKDDERLK